MEDNFSELMDIFNEQKYSINGLYVHLLTDEEEPYKLYKLNMSTNEDIANILFRNIIKAKDAQLYKYHENTNPNGHESLSFIKESEVPGYYQIKTLIENDESTNLTKRTFDTITSNIKGYVINAIVTHKTTGEESHVSLFSTLNRSNLYQPKAGLYRFGSGEGDTLQKAKDTYLELKDNCCAITFNGYIYITHGHYFERLFKYEEHITAHAETMVNEIYEKGLVSNYEIFENKCAGNKNFKRKLYAISTANKLDDVSFETFKRMKDSIGVGLQFSLDVNNKTITINEESSHRSVDQIIRIINDEAAETMVSQTQIFANQKIDIN